MGISVVSAANLSSPGKGAAPQLSADSGGAGFAALLTQQLSAPQLLTMQLEALAGSQSGQDSKAATPGLTEEDASTSQDAGTLLAAAGLLPAMATMAPKTALATGESALSARSTPESGRDQIAGIIGQINARSGGGDMKSNALGDSGQEAMAAAIKSELAQNDTANIAVDTEPAPGNNQSFAATLAAQSAQAPNTHGRSENSAAVTVGTPVGDSRWPQDFGEKVVWLAKNDQQVAQLNINPPQLGPMHITLNLSGDQASALFVSPHAEVRQAIQDAMPQLREMLAGAGINLGQANVGTQLPQQNSGAQPQFSAPSRLGDDNAILRADDGQALSTPISAVRAGRGMVDLFA